MGRAEEVAALSIPFTAGTAAGSLWISTGHTSVGLTMLIVSALLVFHIQKRNSGIAAISLLFFFLGIFCYCSSSGHILPELLSHAIRKATRWRISVTAIINRIGFEYQSSNSLVTALMTGDKSRLDSATMECFRLSGASHILALSGMHLGVIYMISRSLLSVFGNSKIAKAFRAGTIISFSLLYTLMTGAGPSITRAFLFIFLKETINLTPGRETGSKFLLPAALTIHLSLQPTAIDSVSFQLSYLAMTGLVWVSPILSKWYPGTGAQTRISDPFKKIWNTCASSLSCQLFTAPVAWIHFHSFPKYFLLANLIALPLTEAVMATTIMLVVFIISGHRPAFLVKSCETLIQLLRRSMEIISSM